MITKRDCLMLLAEIEKQGIDTTEITNKLLNQNNISLDIIKFINDNRTLSLTNFFEKIRKSYNNSKSKIYINIMKEIDRPFDVITTLNAYAQQILLFSKDVEDKEMFFQHARLTDIYKVLLDYSITGDAKNCINILYYIKTDIKALESLKE